MKEKLLFAPMPPLTDEEAKSNAKEHRLQLPRNNSFRKTALQLFLLLAIPCGAVYLRLRDLPFNSSQWKTKQTVSMILPSTRQRMCNDLIENDKLKGLSKDQVISLLGKPDGGESPEEVTYVVGYNVIDPIMFRVEFGKNKKVASTDIYNTS